MKDHSGAIRGFHHEKAAWYGKSTLVGMSYLDNINIGFYYPDGGTTGEFTVRWSVVGGNIVPQLRVYDDAWDALPNFKDVLDLMAKHDGDNITAEEFCGLLLDCGITDLTARVQP